MSKFYLRVVVVLAVISLAGFGIATIRESHQHAGWMLMTFFVFVALAFRQFEGLKGYAFTITIFAAVSLAMYYPQYFTDLGDFKLSRLIVPLMQILMFGMGTSLRCGRSCSESW